ncbi:cytochrome b/b6 domain-containing protein [Paraburkholderia sp. Ac-20340]|uniref:cytochrome b/b6 domain-containing protein n=1 Tax=Paraburkholderia sp. Ac-20340 TaxID=2703888 RepID=UPI001F11A8C2|nr:cytochrome b/b6 domain-containing protein [Paraburkholderia sp. Ac-20340]
MAMDSGERSETAQSVDWRRVRVWDLPTRLFHWLTVGLVALAWLSQRMNWMQLHVRAGETLLALVLFRLMWGCCGSETARFTRFLATPAAAWRHLRQLGRREPDVQVGHNAAGGWMVMLLLALLFAETLSGLYVNNDIADEGPLSEIVPAAIANMISAIHAYGWDVLAAAVVLHVCAIGLYALLKGHNLVGPMVTGIKPLPVTSRAPRRTSLWLAVLLMGFAALVTALLAFYL